MTAQNQLLLKKLQGIYDRAIATDIPRAFFPILYEFLKVYDNTPALEPVWKSLVLKGDEDTKKLKELEEQAHKDMQGTFEKITKYVTKNKITIPAVTERLEEYRALVEGRASSSNGQIEGKHGALAYVIMCLAQNKEADHIEFAQQFGKIQDDGYIEDWTFAPSYKQWKEEKAIVERLQRTEVWHSWDRLLYFFQIYRDYEKIKKSILKNGNF